MEEPYTLTLIADWTEPIQLSDRTRLLRLDPDQACYSLSHGDTIDLEIKVQAPESMIGDLYYEQLNGGCWPAPGAVNQFFTTALRRDPDQPDATILWVGSTQFGEFSKPEPSKKKGRGYEEKTAKMIFPDGLLLVRPGRFSFMFSLTLRHEPPGGERNFRTFVTDPEVDVGGGAGGPPMPLRRLPRER